MKKTAIVTDSNSGITQSQAVDLGITVIPMPFTLNGETFYEDIDLTQETFYKKLSEDTSIFTSQPTPGVLYDIWDELLKDYEGVVHIPMSSGLSASCQTAMFLAENYDGRVQIADNQRISVTQKRSALDAKALADAGWDARAIKEHLEKTKADSSIYIMVDTLKYLKRGGRVTAAGAALGTILGIKPVLTIQGEKLDSHAKAKGVKQARRIMIDAIKKDFETRFADSKTPDKMWLQMAYTYDRDAAEEFKGEVLEAFPGFDVDLDPLSLSVSCHIGPGALAIGCTKKMDVL